MSTHHTSLLLAIAPLALAAACGDDETGPGGAGGSGTTSATTSPTSTGPGMSTTAAQSTSASTSTGMGGGSGFDPPTPFPVPMSAMGPDQLQSVTAAGAGEFYAAGFAATAVGGQRMVAVVKLTSTGVDTAFGTNGVVTTGVVFAGGSDEIDIATQSDGKIVVSATVANATNPNDRDVAVMRLNADGSPDGTFGTAGVATVNLNDAYDNGMMLVAPDASRSLAIDASGNIFVHAASRGLGMASGGGPRTDTDFTIVKLTPAGVVDATFGTAGQFRLDIAEVSGTPRGIKALSDGTLIASGYANTPDVGDTVQAVLYKLTQGGALDTGFAESGYFHEPVLAVQTEIYNFAIHGGDLVTAGYGRNSGDTNDYVSLRFDTTTGERDLAWGGTPNGAVVVDPSGTMLGSNARNAVGLPGGETVIVGSTGPNNMPEQDAVFVVLDASGMLDTKYGTGIHVLKLGNDGNDQFWGGAVSGNSVALVGFQGGGSMQNETTNDDAYAAVFEIQ